jgi:transcription factor E2F7/8
MDPNDKPYARAQSQTSLVTPTPKKAKLDKKSGAQNPGYSRKKKSLGVLAENFLNQYREAPRGYTVIVDEAAVKLGVERRRIYDVVNILEAIQLVCKKQKNTYTWMGMQHLDVVFGRLQAEAIEEYPQDAKNLLGVSSIVRTRIDDQKEIAKGREFKSLARLSQEFLQVFLVGHTTLSLPDASDKIQGATSMEELVKLGQGRASNMDEKEIKAAAARGLKTKIRRLYDIANVFLSVGLLEKVDSADTCRRPNFSWCYRSSPKDIYDLHNSIKKTTVTPSTSMASSPTQEGDELQKYEV